MSIINQMLTDLETRGVHAGSTAANYSSPLFMHDHYPTRKRFMPVFLVTLLLALLVLAYLKTDIIPSDVNSNADIVVPYVADKESVSVEPVSPELPPAIQVFKLSSSLRVIPEINVAAVQSSADTRRKTGRDHDKVESKDQLPLVEEVKTASFVAETGAMQQDLAKPAASIVISSRSTSAEDAARKYLIDSKRLLSDGVYSSAISLLRKAVESDPLLVEARELLIANLYAEGLYAEAEEHIGVGLQDDPHNEVYLGTRARLLLSRQDYAAVITLLSGHVKSGSASHETVLPLATAYQQSGNHMQAAELYRFLLASDATRAEWWLGFAVSLENIGDSKTALLSYQTVLNSAGVRAEFKQYAIDRIKVLMQ